ncbi:MAG: CPBP family intramembrane metalloprotease [Clostridia bacterium]|nr:CPBP family intramembrane metalloprotease [Clostridia bacterium]
MIKTKKAIGIFIGSILLINVVLSGLIIFNGRGLENNIPYALGLMYSPALIGICVQIFFYKNIKGFGWKLGQINHLLTSYFVPIFYITISYMIFGLLGLIEFDVNSIASLTALDFVQILLINPILLTLLIVGEELGWRGFLLPKLCEVTSFKKASLVVGVIWTLVHYPILIFSDYSHVSTPLLFQVLNFTCLALSVNVIINYLRMESGSLLTAILFHAVHNSVLQDFNQLIIPDSVSEYFYSETGIALAMVCMLMVIILIKLKKTSFNNSYSKSQLKQRFD